MPALGIGGTPRELYAAVAQRNGITGAGVLIFLAQAPGGGEAPALVFLIRSCSRCCGGWPMGPAFLSISSH